MQRLLATLALPLLALPAAAAQVRTVGPHASANFHDLQAAVDGAAEGDVLLVWSGTYASCTIDGKSLRVVERPGNDVHVTGTLTVRNLAPTQTVTLVGLDVQAQHFLPGGAEEALRVEGCLGGVRVERCVLRGAPGLDYSGMDHGGDAGRVDACADVSFVHCELVAGDGAFSFGGFTWNRGGDGLEVHGSSVALGTCTVAAGDGGDQDLIGDGIEGNAGHGLVLVGASVGALHGGSYGGGDGGGLGIACPAGGHGVWVQPGAHAQLLDATLVGGAAGCAPGGTPGDGLRVDAGATATSLAGVARWHESPSPVLGGAPLTMTFHGQPGDLVFVLVSNAPDFALAPALGGARLVGLPLALGRRFLGAIPPSGVLAPTLAAPAAAAPYALETQALFIDPSGGAWLATPSTLVVLN